MNTFLTAVYLKKGFELGEVGIVIIVKGICGGESSDESLDELTNKNGVDIRSAAISGGLAGFCNEFDSVNNSD